MPLLVGTRDGVFRVPDAATNFESAERVLDAGDALRVRRFPGHGIVAATRTGLYRSTDGGDAWTDLGVPREEVFAAVESPDRERLYAGTHPAHLYVSTNGGESWRELEGFQDLPSRESWHTPRHRNEAHVRSLDVHADAPDRVIAGVEVGGVHVSDDRGETWTERRDGLQNDVHHVLVLRPESYVASCGGGLYRTDDAGRSWSRLDRDLDHTYFREAMAHGSRLYAAAARGPPGSWHGDDGADAALFESADGGESFEAVTYPGGPEEVVLAWTVLADRVVAGTNGGRVIARTPEGWTSLGRVPESVRSLATC